LQSILRGEDAELSTEARNELPDSAFCGPERSFPIPDCAHVTAAKRLIGRYKGSDATKAKIMACVNKKAESMKCDSSEDANSLKAELADLQEKYNTLEDKFKELLEIVVIKSKKNKDSIEIEDNVVVSDKKETILDKEIENPSNHANEEVIENKKQEDSLPSFERNVVNTYRTIKDSEGELAANIYLNSKAQYLPRGFNPEKF